jgi:hypothetical protein
MEQEEICDYCKDNIEKNLNPENPVCDGMYCELAEEEYIESLKEKDTPMKKFDKNLFKDVSQDTIDKYINTCKKIIENYEENKGSDSICIGIGCFSDSCIFQFIKSHECAFKNRKERYELCKEFLKEFDKPTKKEPKFKVGDKVRLRKDVKSVSSEIEEFRYVKEPGEVVAISINGNVEVLHKDFISNDLRWFFSPENLEKVEDENKKEPKFKVGDKVVPHQKTAGSHLSNSTVWKKARLNNQPCLCISHVSKNYTGSQKYVCRNIIGGGGDYFNEEDLTLYKEEGTPKFKKGDKVKVVRKVEVNENGTVNWDGLGRMDKSIGKIGTIKDINPTDVTVILDDESLRPILTSNCWAYLPECLELVEDPENEKKFEFNIGDIVTHKRTNYRGGVYEITDYITEGKMEYKVKTIKQGIQNLSTTRGKFLTLVKKICENCKWKRKKEGNGGTCLGCTPINREEWQYSEQTKVSFDIYESTVIDAPTMWDISFSFKTHEDTEEEILDKLLSSTDLDEQDTLLDKLLGIEGEK